MCIVTSKSDLIVYSLLAEVCLQTRLTSLQIANLFTSQLKSIRKYVNVNYSSLLAA